MDVFRVYLYSVILIKTWLFWIFHSFRKCKNFRLNSFSSPTLVNFQCLHFNFSDTHKPFNSAILSFKMCTQLPYGIMNHPLRAVWSKLYISALEELPYGKFFYSKQQQRPATFLLTPRQLVFVLNFLRQISKRAAILEFLFGRPGFETLSKHFGE